MRVVRASTAVHPLTRELPWSTYRFYINRVFRVSAMKKNWVYEYKKYYYMVVLL